MGKMSKNDDKSSFDNTASVFNEDLGFEGVKRKRNTPSYSFRSIRVSMKLKKEDVKKLKERKSRFGNDIPKTGETVERKVDKEDPLHRPLASRRTKNDESDVRICSTESFVGSNLNIEKDYFRLTTHPRKEDVRPYEVLVKALSHIKCKYMQNEDFDWVNNQLKSLRQDIVCQGIRNQFVLNVYETHARILLENGDLNEFNQCQTMICTLTEGTCTGNPGSYSSSFEAYPFSHMWSHSSDEMNKNKLLRQSHETFMEFRSYALLYALVRNSRVELKRELDRMKHLLTRRLMPYESCCEHSLQVVHAVEECNFTAFFRLYSSAPHMSAYLMDFLVKRVRDEAYERIIASFRPRVNLLQIQEWLCLDDPEEVRQFLKQRNAVFIEGEEERSFWVDCKASKLPTIGIDFR